MSDQAGFFNFWERFRRRQQAAVAPPSATFDEAWRDVSWGNKAGDLQYVRDYKPERDDITHLRVLLYGPVGAGKSSFINSVSNVIRGKMTASALANATNSVSSFTKKFETHKIRKVGGTQKTYYPIIFNDIMGLEEDVGSGVRAEDIKLVLGGHVKEGYKFNPVSPLSSSDPSYNSTPSPGDRVHVLVCALSANSTEIKDSVLLKMADIREAASEMGIPQLAIITNVDEACGETEKNLRNVYKSRHVKKKMKDFSAAVGIPMNCIFPVKNYSHEINIVDDVDVLILSVLRQIIDFGEDFLDRM